MSFELINRVTSRDQHTRAEVGGSGAFRLLSQDSVDEGSRLWKTRVVVSAMRAHVTVAS